MLKQQTILLYEKQQAFRASQQWLRGFVAGRGSGKSLIGAYDVALRAGDGEPWMSVSPTNTVIEETTWPTFKEVCETLGIWIRGRQHPSHKAWFRTRDGGIANIVFRSGEKPEHLRGPSKAGLWIDEASITHPDVLTIGSAVLRYKGKMGPLILTFTPKGKRHWTFEVFYDRVDETTEVHREGQVHYAIVEDPKTGEAVRRELHYYGGVPFTRKTNTDLFHAHTLENPFLPADFYDKIRANYTQAFAAQELGGEFVELAGLMFMREWYEYVDIVPREALRVRYWDRAATHGAGKYSAGVLVAYDPTGRIFIEDVVRGQWSALQRDQMIISTAQADAAKYDGEVIIYAEQEGGSGGKEVAEQLVRKLAGFPVYSDVVSGATKKIKDKLVLPGEAKIVRAMPHAAQAEAGNVFIKRARWNHDYLEELLAFPEYAFSDQVDATSGAVNKLRSMGGGVDPGRVHRINGNAAALDSAERFGVRLIRSRQRRRNARGGLGE